MLLDTAHRWTSAVDRGCGAGRGSGRQEVCGAWQRRASADGSPPRRTCLSSMVGPGGTAGAPCVTTWRSVPDFPPWARPQALYVSQHTISTLALVEERGHASVSVPRGACPGGPIEEPMSARPPRVDDATFPIHATDNAWQRRAISAFSATMASSRVAHASVSRRWASPTSALVQK